MITTGLKAALTSGIALVAMATSAIADIKIGLLADMSGPTSVLTGVSSQRAIEMAIDEFGGAINGEKIVLTVADHLSKPDVGLGIARQWVDGNAVDLLFGVDHSAVALAISDLIRDKNVAMFHGASTTLLTNDKCGPNQVQMLMDSYGLSRAITIPLVQAGRKKWYYISVDYALGQDLQARGEEALAKSGGTLVGSAKHSPQTTDFSSFLIEAKAKGAQSIGLATFGTWQVAIAKQAAEFGMDIPLAPFFLGDTDIKAVGLESLQNVQGAIQFYWDQNDKSREFAKRFQQRYNRPPTFTNAMNYEFIVHYLNAVKAVGSRNASAIVKKMRETPMPLVNGDVATIREDGRTLRALYSFVTKTPKESKGDWDYLKITGTIPAESLAPPLSESTCPLIKK